jgi:feruloyl-CoA synthase
LSQPPIANEEEGRASARLDMTIPRYRPVAGNSGRANVKSVDGNWYVQAAESLGAFPDNLTECLISGAQDYPERWIAASRSSDGHWRGVSYAVMLSRARAIARSLLVLRLPAGRPIAILSGNGMEHLQLSMGAMFAGIATAPLSPAWSLTPNDFSRLRHAFDTLDPSMVFAADWDRFRNALDAVDMTGRVLVSNTGAPGAMSFASLAAAHFPDDVAIPSDRLSPDTVVKYLFTSGSTGMPKAVPTTHRMLCSNQQMLLQTFPQFGVEPPVLVDWLPWHHTYGGSHNVGIVLYNGGTLYIDEGKPAPGSVGVTLRNLADIAPTAYFNVPKGWDDLAGALETDAVLANKFFSRLQMMFFAGAGLSQATWDRLDRLSERYCGERVRMMSGLGMTETSPASLFATLVTAQAGYIGVPAPGCDIKLADVEGRLELRYKGPHVMRGYHPTASQAPQDVFDAEGYFCSGDAATFLDPAHPELGLRFDGRLADNFKLASGVFVDVTALRTHVISLVDANCHDVVVTGIDRTEIGVLVFPLVDACRTLSGLGSHASVQMALASTPVRAAFSEALRAVNASSAGSSSFVAWFALLDEPASIDTGELTEKGAVSARKVLDLRRELIGRLYDRTDETTLVLYAN